MTIETPILGKVMLRPKPTFLIGLTLYCISCVAGVPTGKGVGNGEGLVSVIQHKLLIYAFFAKKIYPDFKYVSPVGIFAYLDWNGT